MRTNRSDGLPVTSASRPIGYSRLQHRFISVLRHQRSNAGPSTVCFTSVHLYGFSFCRIEDSRCMSRKAANACLPASSIGDRSELCFVQSILAVAAAIPTLTGFSLHHSNPNISTESPSKKDPVTRCSRDSLSLQPPSDSAQQLSIRHSLYRLLLHGSDRGSAYANPLILACRLYLLKSLTSKRQDFVDPRTAETGRVTPYSDIGLEFLCSRCCWPKVLLWEMRGITRQ